MNKVIFLLIIIMLSTFAFGQNMPAVSSKDYWDSTTVTLTNSDTIVSNERTMYAGRSADFRVTVYFDTTSGASTKMFFDLMYKIGQADPARDWKTAVIDSFLVADDHTSKTYQFNDYSLYPYLRAPILKYKFRMRQTDTQTNRFMTEGIEYQPR